jgi:uncharacterized membrane protein YhaH (DUF805 family)
MMEWYLKVLQDYAVFDGRAQRMEYWMFVLFNMLIIIVIGTIEQVIGTGGSVGFLYGLAVLIPGVAVSVRRLHDTDRSGWWLLLSLVPLIGTLVLLIFYCIDGDYGDNDYGPDPKHYDYD